ncbi:hypothetical protein [Leucobacter denitrificans]|uniref:Uncharacterized protein n=1 Tax=Leucobacter denitrificans TaxID=683042 RepID=A0A7G9S511_9MICO|nr:hypothetical protein [Leucobacter denitrificans]QNN62936.1 hypothetical protein H9L06_00655 [Leucobacter denitrificans]
MSVYRSNYLPWSRIRPLGSVSATLVLVGTTVLAPFSLPNAYASSAPRFVTPAAHQALTSTAATDTILDLDITLTEEDGGRSTHKDHAPAPAALYTLEQFMFTGSVNWGGYRFTYYSQQVLPGGGLAIPGRHVNAGGYVSDGDGYIVLAGSAPKGTVYETPFGYPGKIYDRGTVGNHLDVYIL